MGRKVISTFNKILASTASIPQNLWHKTYLTFNVWRQHNISVSCKYPFKHCMCLLFYLGFLYLMVSSTELTFQHFHLISSTSHGCMDSLCISKQVLTMDHNTSSQSLNSFYQQIPATSHNGEWVHHSRLWPQWNWIQHFLLDYLFYLCYPSSV
jgi:hypothetical protein